MKSLLAHIAHIGDVRHVRHVRHVRNAIRITRRMGAILLGVVAWAPMTVTAAGPLDTALAALAAEERAPLERIRLFVERNGIADVYYIDQVRPGRTRVIKNPRQGGLQSIVIDKMQWVLTDAGWHASPAPPASAPGAVPALASLLKQGLTDASEQAAPGGGREVQGSLSWTDAVTCTGKLTMQIASTGLPSLMRFEGTCGGKPTRFRQAFSFEGPLAIDPPK
jgi:hypothetical protein